MLWDIFCRVIDNLGDLGVCWRLSADLAARGHSVRLWVDDGQALHWMAPGALEGNWPGVAVLPWQQSVNPQRLQSLIPADVWIEAFGCDVPEPFVAHRVQALANAVIGDGPATSCKPPTWLNLEYLSAESYVERSHALPSPLMHGPARGWTKTFFYPGFTAQTGGLLREPDLLERMAQESTAAARSQFFTTVGVPWQGEQVVTLFCYEPALLSDLLEQLAASPKRTLLLVTAGRATCAVQALQGAQTSLGNLRLAYLPTLTQLDFDRLLWHADVNFVRGEDSVLRALWAGKPFVWHIYPQEDQAHEPKLEAFLDRLELGPEVRQLHRAWNGLLPQSALAALQPPALPQWRAEVLAARASLLKMDDLVGQLTAFVRNQR